MSAGTIGQLVNDAAARFTAAGFDSPRLDARLLIGHILGLAPSLLFARAEDSISAEHAVAIEKLVARRLVHEPVSRIVGVREFWSLEFQVTPDVLDPRPDTETLVSSLLALKLELGSRPVRILDLGTGTGCILLAALGEWHEASGLGIDLSAGAVAVARANAVHHGLESRAAFKVGNWCDGLEERFDVIVSNPPYIANAELPLLAPEVLRFDPSLALDGGDDGLAAYRTLIPAVRERLWDDGRLILEIGAGQAGSVTKLLIENGFRLSAKIEDLAGISRCLVATTIG